MQKLLLLFGLLIMLRGESTAQCQTFNGSFEEWSDETDTFEFELALALKETVILPTGWLPRVRLLEIALSSFFIEYLDKDTLDIPVFQAVQQYTPGANNTMSAIKISGDSLFGTSDLLQIAPCGGRPDKLTGYIKYEGIGVDTLIISAILLHSTDLIDTAEAIGFAVFSAVGGDTDISRNAAEFVPFSVDLIYNSEEIADSVAIHIIAIKDINNPSDTSYFVVDEIKLEGGSVATRDFYQEVQNALTPNPARDLVSLNLPVNTGARLEIFNALGARVLHKELHGVSSFSVSHLTAGTYVARIHQENQVFWQKLLVTGN